MAYDDAAATTALRWGAAWPPRREPRSKEVEVGMVYDTKTPTRFESRWDMALVTFAFVVSLMVVLALPAFALI